MVHLLLKEHQTGTRRFDAPLRRSIWACYLMLCLASSIKWAYYQPQPYKCRRQGINLKGCLYFIGKGNLKFSLSKWRFTSKIALHVCIEVFVESAHYHVYHLSDVENYNISSFWRVYKKLPLPFWRECEGLDPKIRVIALQFYSLLASMSENRDPCEPALISHFSHGCI